MNNLKRLGIFLLVAAALMLLSVGYKGNAILKRAIVLGIGVDVADDDELLVTAEIVSPGNNGEEVGMFSKIVSATGHTVAEAMQHISERTGKETSLGQCVLLMYGEEYIAKDFTETANYFARSDSFKESAIVCCCKGRAEEMLNLGDAVSQSVSLSLADKLKGLAKEVAIPSCDLLTYARSQQELYQTGFLNYITFQPSQNTSTVNPDQEQGYFLCNRVAVLRHNKLVGILTEEETLGFAVLDNKVVGNTFAVKDEQGNHLTLRANTKDVGAKQKDGTISLSVSMLVRLARTDSFGAGGQFAAETEAEIEQPLLDQAKEEAQRLAKLFLDKQIAWDFDLLHFHDALRQERGSTDEVKNMPMTAFAVKLEISVKEK